MRTGGQWFDFPWHCNVCDTYIDRYDTHYCLGADRFSTRPSERLYPLPTVAYCDDPALFVVEGATYSHDLRPLPPLEMACHDAGRNIPREFGLAIQRALVFFGLIALLLTAIFFVGGYHFVKTPTEDQLYGCTWENQDAETGACK